MEISSGSLEGWEPTTLSYAVRDFYLNSGSQAIIVRLYKDPNSASDAKTSLKVDGLSLVAKSPGAWGKKLRATIDVEVSNEMRTRLGLGANDALFNLTIRLGNNVEKFLNLTVTNNARRIDRVLEAESNLVEWEGDWKAPKMEKLADVLSKRKDLADKMKALANAEAAEPPVQATIDAAKAAVATAQTAYDTALADLDDAVTKAEKGSGQSIGG